MLKRGFFILVAACLSLNVYGVEVQAETTDQKIDGIARQISLLSANFDSRLIQVFHDSSLVSNELEEVKIALQEQSSTLQSLKEAIKELQSLLEKQHVQQQEPLPTE